MQNANGSQGVSLHNRRVRGSKPSAEFDGGAGAPASGGKREAAIASRSSSPAPGGKVVKTPTLADELAASAAGAPDGVLEQREPPRTKTQKVSAIAQLLRDGLIDDDGGDADGDDTAASSADGIDPETGTSGPVTLETVAEALGVEVAELWEQVEFNDGAGKTHKLGALKDLLKQTTDQEARELAFAEQKSSEENDLLRRRQELDYVLRSLPKSAITPEMATRAATERTRVLELERKRTLEAIPDWRNSATEKSDRTAIGQYITQFGYAAGDLERMFDHRMLKLLRDSWQRFERVNNALAKVKEQQDGRAAPPSKAANSGGRRARAPQVRANAPRSEKVAAVAQLLREGLPRN